MSHKKTQTKLTLFGITSRTMMSAAALLLAASYLSVLFNPAKAWFMTIFGLLYAPLFLLNLFLLLWAIVRHSRAFLIPAIALLPTIFLCGLYYQFPSESSEETPDIRILSYNVGRFASATGPSKDLSQSACADSVMTFIASRGADVICLQEFYISDVKKLRSYIGRYFRGYNIEYYVYPTAKGCYGNVTLSRFPMYSKDKIDFPESANLAIYCDLRIGKEKLRVYNCHFQSYGISLPGLAGGAAKGDKEYMAQTEGKMRRSIVQRPKQVQAVMDDISRSSLPAMVVGDFNDNPMSYTYYKLRKGRKDSFEEAGSGFGSTYHYLYPMLRIDYVLFPKQYRALGHQVLRETYSDHYPIETDLVI